jgi:hypothetical protein
MRDYEAANPSPAVAEKLQASTPQAPEQQQLAEVVQQIVDRPVQAAPVEAPPVAEVAPATPETSVPLTSQESTPTVSKVEKPASKKAAKPRKSKRRDMLSQIKDMGYKSVDEFIRKDPEGYQQFADKWSQNQVA